MTAPIDTAKAAFDAAMTNINTRSYFPDRTTAVRAYALFNAHWTFDYPSNNYGTFVTAKQNLDAAMKRLKAWPSAQNARKAYAVYTPFNTAYLAAFPGNIHG